MEDIKFLEIEHKYLLDDTFDHLKFLDQVESLGPSRTSQVVVTDTYYLTKKCPNYIYRHRLDSEIQHLTLKGLTEDPEARLEVNLDLGLHKGDQSDRISAFLKPLDPYWRGEIYKKVWVFYFSTAEVVYYEASHDGKAVRCIEIEAINASSLEDGKKKITEFEINLGLDSGERCRDSLFHLLLLPNVPQ